MQIFELFSEDSSSQKDAIEKLQNILNDKGADIAVDGIMGPETLAATYIHFPELIPADIKPKLEIIAKRTDNFTSPVNKPKKQVSTKTAPTNSFRDQDFQTKLREVAEELGIEPSDLAAIIYTESRGNPRAKAFNVSVGLIGFTEGTARKLGTSKERILAMSAIDQLDLVKNYYKMIGVRPGMDRGSIYMLTFLPAFVNAPDNTVLGKQGGGNLITPSGRDTKLSMDRIWFQNPVFGKSQGRDFFTVRDVKNHIARMPAPLIDESINEADVNPVDTIELDVPLLLRMMEYAREDAKTDMDLHDVTEKMISLSKTGEGLSMKDYESIVGGEENLGETGNMNIPAMPDITGLQPGQTKMLGNGERVTLGADGKVYLQGGFGVVTYNQQGQALDYKTPTFGGLSSTQNVATGKTTATYNPIKSMNITQPIDTKQEAIGGNSSEEFLKNVEYKPRHQAKPKRTLMGDPVREGHGRYWCSTDKRWKERQGPKQSRS